MNEGILILEDTKYERKYQCPYCDYKAPKGDLVKHIEEEHESVIPEEHTAARIVFNIVNKKSVGKCTECRKETKWNEKTWRYERFCSIKCQNEYSKQMKQRMLDKHGKVHLLNSMEKQKEMLSKRRISGSYKFSNGVVKEYVGSYEKMLLQFMDQVMEVDPKDLESPGPIIKYDFKGKSLAFITDLYYIPFNLIFDIKDGGSNKNTNPALAEYREKQIAKEEAIKKLGKYNYIRLTDNNFHQLMHVMAEIKKSMMEGHKDPVIHINEMMLGIRSSRDEPAYYLIPYGDNKNEIRGVGFTKNLLMNNTFVHDDYDGKIKVKSKDFFKDKYYSIVKVDSNIDGYKKILEVVNNEDEVWDLTFMTRAILNIDLDPIELFINEEYSVIHSSFDMTKFDILKDIKNISESIENIIPDRYRSNPKLVIECSLLNIEKETQSNNKLKGYPNLKIYENYNGYFVKNMKTNKRSGYYDDIDSIPKYILDLV